MDQQLKVFVTVAERQSFSRAAEALHMTQPAVSQHIQALEKIVGTKLLDRNNKFVRLTRAGDVVYRHAQEILGLYSRMQRLVDDLMHVESGALAIGASYTFGEYILPHAIARFRERYPHITPTITIANTRVVAEQVANHQLDVGLIEGEYTHDTLSIEPFAHDLMVVIAAISHPLVNQAQVNMRELEPETWIMRERGSGTREVSERAFAQFSFTPASVMEFGSTQVIKEAVEEGLGVSILSKWAIRKELTLCTLQELDVQGFPMKRRFSLVTHKSESRTKAMDLFTHFLRATAPTLDDRPQAATKGAKEV